MRSGEASSLLYTRLPHYANGVHSFFALRVHPSHLVEGLKACLDVGAAPSLPSQKEGREETSIAYQGSVILEERCPEIPLDNGHYVADDVLAANLRLVVQSQDAFVSACQVGVGVVRVLRGL